MLLFGALELSKGDVLRYILTPQIAPRLREFYQSGFGHLAYIMALVYRAVNIIPEGHALLQKENRQSLTLRGVLAGAANEISFTKGNIDKIIIYFLLLIGLIMLGLQFFVTLAYVMVNPALANNMPTQYGEFFATPQYDTDVAYRLLYTVFGVPDIFRPGAALSEFHVALHSLFQFYSIGLLVVAVLIVCYFIFAVLVETAQTGVPFGKRYKHVWAPIRLVFALGLLIPIGYGLNAAQWITLYSAKFGSDFATQGWINFNDVVTEEYLDDADKRVGTPQAPEIMPLAAFMMTVNACRYAYENLYSGTDQKEILAYLVKPTATGGAAKQFSSTRGFWDALSYFDGGDILIRFGEYNPNKYANYKGYVYPYCGDLLIIASSARESGAQSMQQFYYDLTYRMYMGVYDIRQTGIDLLTRYINDPTLADSTALLPDPEFKANLAETLYTEIDAAIAKAVDIQSNSTSWDKDAAQVRELGWGGAGIWYNKIAQINGSLVTSVGTIPQVRQMPAVMEFVRTQQLQSDVQTSDAGAPNISGDEAIRFDSNYDKTIAEGLSIINRYWSTEDLRQDGLGSQTRSTDNIFIDTVNLIFGTRGLFDMCASAEVHPLAQLSTLGKGLIEATIRNLGLAFAAGVVGSLPIPFIGAAAGAASSILLSIATVTLTMGFMLFYVLPFMPFLYFFFAVGGWIKGLFEAMVGVPLWALAHLRIDGEGLPGDAAMDGIYLIFEIFLRPILIIFGLLASVIIFGATVKVLNEIFSLVVVNLAGHDPNATSICGRPSGGTGPTTPGTIAYLRGPVDELFFTVMYAVIVYMIGMSCFKLIDLVPNNILRYMGARVNSFNDKQDDPAQGMMTNLSVATSMVSSKVLGGGGIISGATGFMSNTGRAAMELGKTE